MSRDDGSEEDDIYNFDYLKDNSQLPARPQLKPKTIQDNRIRLPPVLIGRNIAAANNEHMAAMVNRQMSKSVFKQDDVEKDWHKERMKLKGPRQPQKEYYDQVHVTKRIAHTPAQHYVQRYQNTQAEAQKIQYNTSDVGYAPSRGLDVVHGAGHPIFPDPRPPATRNVSTVLERKSYLEGLKHARHGEHRQEILDSTQQAKYTYERSHPSVFDKDYLTPEEKAAAVNYDIEKAFEKQQTDMNFPRKMELPKIPQPPSTPKPRDYTEHPGRRRRIRYADGYGDNVNHQAENSDGSRQQIVQQESITREVTSRLPFPPNISTYDKPDPPRRGFNVRFADNTELNQDVSIHNAATRPFHQGRPKTPYVIDYDKEVCEAVVLNKRFDDINKMLQGMKSTGCEEESCLNAINEILKSPTGSPLDVRPNTAALANKNGVGSLPELPFKQIQPQLRAEPIRDWNGDVARRGVGFKSKLRKEAPEKKVDSNANLPVKIRKQIEKYLN